MTENLQEMLKEFKEKSEAGLVTNGILSVDESKPKEEPKKEVKVKEKPTEVKPLVYKTVSLVEIINKYKDKIQKTFDIKIAKIEASGIESSEDILFTIKDPEGGKNKKGDPRRRFAVVENAHMLPIPDVEPESLRIFKGNGCVSTIHRLDEFLYVRSYALKTGVIVVSCLDSRDAELGEKVVKLIPYDIQYLKRKDCKEITINFPKSSEILAKLKLPADSEGIYLLYKQAQKVHDTLKTNQDVLDFFLKRRSEVFDINHLIQIDEVLKFVFNK